MKLHESYKFLIPAVVVFIALIIGIGFWLYTGKISSVKAAIFNATNLPAARVDGQFISVKEVISRYALLKSVDENTPNINQEKIRDVILDKLVEDKLLNIFSVERGVKFSNDDLNNFYTELVNKLTSGDEKQLEQVIGSYSSLSKGEFKNQVLRNYLQLNGLKTWYNSQADLNKQAYIKVDNIKNAAQQGSDFASLAAQFSDDKYSATFEGDSGFVEVSRLAPEFSKALANTKTGDIVTVPTADGISIVKLLERNLANDGKEESIRVQQIFIQTTGYDAWFAQEKAKYKVTKYIENLSF